uniref:Tyrosine-protein kinase ephrin type A/B receptor-like domain-containing protein n=1 Tax=Hanusia phi TaxID=3032 RepID=A0A7S0HCL1_9CRYP|mmetsp:Transcript_15941/g.36428  ORF Transcript_15941/g.36428 Transcript_15941/m.36428 type:complete len:713 (+) Transcript_15941:1-2139(+)
MNASNSSSNSSSNVSVNSSLDRGWHFPYLVTCYACPAGTFKPNNGSGSCISCPQNMTSNVSSTSELDCKCQQGFRHIDSSTCEVCNPGTYSMTAGSLSCLPCDPGSFQDKAGASACVACPNASYVNGSGASTCLSCPPNASSSLGSSECLCDAGFTRDGNSLLCVPCSAGTYKESIENSACEVCGANASSMPGSKSRNECACLAGFQGFPACSPCNASQHKPDWGDGACSECEAGKLSNAARTSCTCPIGFGGLNRSSGGVDCIRCEPGTYKDIIGDFACQACPAGMVSSPGASFCFCSAGYAANFSVESPVTGFCVACSPGSYRDSESSETCSPCAPGFFAGSNAQSACQACPSGTYNDGIGLSSCSQCSEGTWSLPGSTSCSSDGFLTTLAGDRQTGSRDGVGRNATFANPVGVSVSSDSLRVAVADYLNSLIRLLVVPHRQVTTVAGQSGSGFEDGECAMAKFDGPIDVAWEKAGEFLFVADFWNNRVRGINLTSCSVATVAGSGAFGQQDGETGVATFAGPCSLALYAEGSKLLVAEFSGHSVRVIDLSAKSVTTLAGSGRAGSSNGVGVLAQFKNPWDLTMSEDEDAAFLIEFESSWVRAINLSTAEVSTLNISHELRNPAGISLWRPRGSRCVNGSKTGLLLLDNYGRDLRVLDVLSGEVKAVKLNVSTSWSPIPGRVRATSYGDFAIFSDAGGNEILAQNLGCTP